MKVITQTILTAEEGFYLTDGESYGKTVILPAGVDTANWHEITDEAYTAIQTKQEERYEEDISVPV
jgi:hypothetical protein